MVGVILLLLVSEIRGTSNHKDLGYLEVDLFNRIMKKMKFRKQFESFIKVFGSLRKFEYLMLN